ncbi:MAG TPA: hypothetical protein VF884_00845 [Nitrososphaeraceae archaeon]
MDNNTSKKKNQDGDNHSEGQNSGNWSEMVTQLVDKMTGKDVSIKYEFEF